MQKPSDIIVPPLLGPGDRIGIVLPSGYMDPERIIDCIRFLSEAGYEVVTGETLLGKSDNYFSGTDEERRIDLQKMLDDTSIAAILFGRGGYGMGRIIDSLDFSSFVQSPKWIVGFSDITILHNHIFSNFGIVTIHGPMAAAFIGDGAHGNSVASLMHALTHSHYRYIVDVHPYNRLGTCSGTLIGGNLALLVNAIGTPSDMDYEGKILFIEDIGEYLYSLDRMLLQMHRAGKFRGLTGLVLGGFTDMKDTVRPFGKQLNDILRDRFAEYNFPLCFGFPVSHDEKNLALKHGLAHTLEVGATAVTLSLPPTPFQPLNPYLIV